MSKVKCFSRQVLGALREKLLIQSYPDLVWINTCTKNGHAIGLPGKIIIYFRAVQAEDGQKAESVILKRLPLYK